MSLLVFGHKVLVPHLICQNFTLHIRPLYKSVLCSILARPSQILFNFLIEKHPMAKFQICTSRQTVEKIRCYIPLSRNSVKTNCTTIFIFCNTFHSFKPNSPHRDVKDIGRSPGQMSFYYTPSHI